MAQEQDWFAAVKAGGVDDSAAPEQADDWFAAVAGENPAGAGRGPHPLDVFNPESGIRKAPGRIGRFLRENAVPIAATAGAMATGPAIIPAAAVAGLAGGAARGGQLALDAFEKREDPLTLANIKDVAKTGAEAGVMEGAGGVMMRGVGMVGRGAQSGARKLMEGVIKPDRGRLEKMAGAQNRSLGELASEVADTFVSNDINPTSPSGWSSLQAAKRATGGNRSRMIREAPQVPNEAGRDRVHKAIAEVLYESGRGDAPQKARSQTERFIRQLLDSPDTSEAVSVSKEIMRPGDAIPADFNPDMINRMRALTPVEEEAALTRLNRSLKGRFGIQNTMPPAEQTARHALAGARRANLRDIKGVVDGKETTVGEQAELLRKLIDASKVASVASRRVQSRNPIQMTDVLPLVLGATTGHPAAWAALAGSIALKPQNMARESLLLNRVGQRLENPSELTQLVRRLVMQAGTGPSPEQ